MVPMDAFKYLELREESNIVLELFDSNMVVTMHIEDEDISKNNTKADKQIELFINIYWWN